MFEIKKPLKWKRPEVYADFVITVFDLILAANFMDIKPLLDLTYVAVDTMIKGKKPEDIRSISMILWRKKRSKSLTTFAGARKPS